MMQPTQGPTATPCPPSASVADSNNGAAQRIRTIAIYAPFTKGLICHGLYPLLITARYRLRFIPRTTDPAADLAQLLKTQADLLICAGILRGVAPDAPEIVELLTKARQHYRQVFYFDDQDSCVIHSSAYMRFFDKWLKKQIYANKNLYTKSFEGGRIYAHYYCRAFGADPTMSRPIDVVDRQDLKTIQLAWSICLGVYPRSLGKTIFDGIKDLPFPLIRIRLFVHHQMAMLALALRCLRWWLMGRLLERDSICLARFDESKYSASIGYQRFIYRAICQRSPDLFATEKVPLATYQRELFYSEACLSPFGWGEVCYRDAEAARAGAVLVKPSMQHLLTWPDLYGEDRAVSIDWAGSRLVDRVASVLTNRRLARRLRRRAGLALLRANWELPARVRHVLESSPEP